MPGGYHIVEKLVQAYEEHDFFPLWITGKGANIKGDSEKSPHHAVYKMIVDDKHPGIYHGDVSREDQEVNDLARGAVEEAIRHDNFLCFIHFLNPDHTGHKVTRDGAQDDFNRYMRSALEVDEYIAKLMSLLPNSTDVIYCSDHGFDFISQGDPRNGHKFSPPRDVGDKFQHATQDRSLTTIRR